MTDDMASELSFSDVPQVYKRHIFACFTQRPLDHPRGSCGAGAQPLWERLGNRIEREGLSDVGFTASGCLGFCAAGPLMVIYPKVSGTARFYPRISTKLSRRISRVTSSCTIWQLVRADVALLRTGELIHGGRRLGCDSCPLGS